MLKLNDLSAVLFDVDGTIYQKDVEYNPKTGSIQVAHDFFKYLAHQMLKEGIDPSEVSALLTREYQKRIREGTLKERVLSINPEERQEFDHLVEEYGANGRVFDHWHGLQEKGVQNFLHRLLSQIDFQATLGRDEKLLQLFDNLERKGYDLGIITSEVYDTIETMASAMGFDLERFFIGDNKQDPDLYSERDQRFYPFVCRNNSIAKPDLDGFRKVLRILGVNDPKRLVYVGDSLTKDIVPALNCGWNAVLVTNTPGFEVGMDTAIVGSQEVSYFKIGSIHDLSEVV